ncbi:GNAT family N-acetyltransferase [Massilia violaceinigra]|uniref:GNAT family N-acetyltransferase n=1 Tax=Massilia violaceinigra TaxID=2045208 RepID=A0A2D2DIW7_9BURK|nr:GNAT family N-acetyltransferase [Massilia violaceinigra]ATQ74928.1 GNAT family N-acetyltransferase [Massilia violaceinigra]
MNGGKGKPAVLIGKRVRLRLIEERDASGLFELYSDQDVMRYWNHAPWTRPEQADRAVEEARSEHASGISLHYVIEHLSTKKLIGSCALYAVDQENRCAALGYLLAKSCWGQGYLSEAMQRFLGYAFMQLTLDSIHADIHPGNAASAKALTRLGFRQDRDRRASWLVGGAQCATASYRLTRRDWLESAVHANVLTAALLDQSQAQR